MKAAVLYPGKQNHWIVALPGASGTLAEREDAARVWFTAWFGDRWEDLRVTGAQVGHPDQIQARFVSIDFDAELPADTTYVALAFDYLGTRDWMEWPESGGGQLWAVAQGVPTIHLKTPWEELLDNIDRTGDDIADDAKDAAAAAGNALDQVPTVLTVGLMGLGILLLARGK